MWKLELNEGKTSRIANPVVSKEQWYSKGASFWAVFFLWKRFKLIHNLKSTEATYKGVTGGFPNLNDLDVQASKKFLSSFLLDGMIENKRAIGKEFFSRKVIEDNW